MNYLKMSSCIKYKCYIIIDLTFLKELMLIRQVSQICHYLYFLNKGFKFQANVSNGCHEL